MDTEAQLLFQMGAIMLLAFIAATLARKMNQSVMIGYIAIGILIGPKISVEILGYEYHGLITDTSLISMLSFVGLVMLMFFVGLEFSFSKLKKTRTPAIILAVIDTSVGLFVGFMFASFLGWPLIDSIFLAGVIAMSSTSIAMKVLFDLKRMSSPEVEFLIGLVVVETFIAMLILTVASGMVVRPEADPSEYGQLLLGKGAFVAIFFTSFGMMIDPAMFPDVIWMVALAIPLVILYEVFVMSSITYFLGFSAKASMTIGTSASGRGVESILYASVGSNVKGATMGSLLNPFAGVFCFAMSAISPALVKHSAALANAAGKVVPKQVRFSS